MRVIELFAGQRSVSKSFEDRGHETFSVEWDKKHDSIDWYVDIGSITASDLVAKFGVPDVLWASPDCTTYSVAAISKHRRKEPNGNLKGISEYAIFSDKVNENVVQIITVTYCQYGDERMKPTDLWTNHPDPKFKDPCKNGDKCHVSAPRGSQTGTQGRKGSVERSLIPKELCDHIVDICEEIL